MLLYRRLLQHVVYQQRLQRSVLIFFGKGFLRCLFRLRISLLVIFLHLFLPDLPHKAFALVELYLPQLTVVLGGAQVAHYFLVLTGIFLEVVVILGLVTLFFLCSHLHPGSSSQHLHVLALLVQQLPQVFGLRQLLPEYVVH